jgi:hypothetical protein
MAMILLKVKTIFFFFVKGKPEAEFLVRWLSHLQLVSNLGISFLEEFLARQELE